MATARRTPTRKPRGPLKGRALVAIGLAVFFVVTTAVVWRRSQGVATQRAINKINDETRRLRAQEKTLENDVRLATSRRRVVPEAERRLGMTRPNEMQTRFITTGPGATRAASDSTVADSVSAP